MKHADDPRDPEPTTSALYAALKSLHATYDESLILSAMRAMFGEPVQCINCGKPLHWKDGRYPGDVDPWFCSGCCPICLA